MPKAKLEPYEAEMAADTLLRAESIRKDKRLLTAAKKELKKKQTAVAGALKANTRAKAPTRKRAPTKKRATPRRKRR